MVTFECTGYNEMKAEIARIEVAVNVAFDEMKRGIDTLRSQIDLMEKRLNVMESEKVSVQAYIAQRWGPWNVRALLDKREKEGS